MRVLIAPDKFKGSLSAEKVGAAMAAGVRDAVASVEIQLCPMADGGDGSAEVLLAACGGRHVACRVVGPLPERHVDAGFVLLDDGTAVVEMAAASGIALLEPAERGPAADDEFRHRPVDRSGRRRRRQARAANHRRERDRGRWHRLRAGVRVHGAGRSTASRPARPTRCVVETSTAS